MQSTTSQHLRKESASQSQEEREIATGYQHEDHEGDNGEAGPDPPQRGDLAILYFLGGWVSGSRIVRVARAILGCIKDT